MSDWIKVEENLPNPNERVLISNCRGTHIGFLNEQNKWVEVSKPKYELKTVTHWQRLPDPPDGKEPKPKKVHYQYPETLLCAIWGKPSYEEIGANCDIETAKERLEIKLQDLSAREREMLFLRFKEKLTLRKIGEKYGLSGQRIKQIECKALRKLRHPKRSRFVLTGQEINP